MTTTIQMMISAKNTLKRLFPFGFGLFPAAMLAKKGFIGNNLVAVAA